MGVVRTKRSNLFLVCAMAMAFAVGCSDKDKGPPDDDDKFHGKAASLCVEHEFAACALEVLSGSSLSANDVASLSSCDFEDAVAQDSAADVFAVAQAAVGSACR